MSLLKTTLRQIWNLVTGRAKKKIHLIVTVFVAVMFFGACYLSQQFFIGGYSIFEHTVSSQGNIIVNPDGAWIFNYACIIAGLVIICHYLYLYRRLLPVSPTLTNFFLATGIIGCIGLVMLGFNPSHVGPSHNFSAHVAFNGFALSVLSSMPLILRRFLRMGDENHQRPLVAATAISFCLIGFLIYLEFFLNDHQFWIDILGLEPTAVNFPFHEWLLLIICALSLVAYPLVLPNVEAKNERDRLQRISMTKRLSMTYNLNKNRFPGLFECVLDISMVIIVYFAIFEYTKFPSIEIINLQYLEDRIIFLKLSVWQSLIIFVIAIAIIKMTITQISGKWIHKQSK